MRQEPPTANHRQMNRHGCYRHTATRMYIKHAVVVVVPLNHRQPPITKETTISSGQPITNCKPPIQ
jgi:hypothetical protein